MTTIVGSPGGGTLISRVKENNTLQGGARDDSYVFPLNHGFDTIIDAGGIDAIRLANGIGWGDVNPGFDSALFGGTLNVRLYRGNAERRFPGAPDDLVLSVVNEDGVEQSRVVVQDHFASARAQVESMEISTPTAEVGFDLVPRVGNVLPFRSVSRHADGAVPERLDGTAFADRLISNVGQDQILLGGAGQDTYEFPAGHGFDTIIDTDTGNFIQFEPGIGWGDATSFLPAQLYVRLHRGSSDGRFPGESDDLVLSVVDRDGVEQSRVVVRDQFASAAEPVVEWLTLRVGNTSSSIGLAAGPAAGLGLTPTAGLQLWPVSQYADGTVPERLDGTAFNDRLFSNVGQDLIFAGGDGNDQYEFPLGHGFDTIAETGGSDVVRFAFGIGREDEESPFQATQNMRLYRGNADSRFPGTPDDLVLSVVDEAGVEQSRVVVQHHFALATAQVEVLHLRLDTGQNLFRGLSGGLVLRSVSMHADGAVPDRLDGTPFNDRLITNAGQNQTLAGGDGDDTYEFPLGHGFDTIVETGGHDSIRFDDAINPVRVRLLRSTEDDRTNDLLIDVLGNGSTIDSQVRVADYFGSPAAQVETIMLGGVEYALGDLLQPLVAQGRGGRLEARPTDQRVIGGVGDDVIIATLRPVEVDLRAGGNNRVLVGLGPDTVLGGAGNDVILAGRGGDNRIDLSAGGNNRVTAGDGADTIIGGSGRDVIRPGRGDDLVDLRTGGDNFVFNLRGDSTILGGAGDDVIFGGIGDTRILAGGGNNRIMAGPGRDMIGFMQEAHETRLLDFRPGSDVMDFTGHDGVSGLDDLTLRQIGTNTIIDDGSGGRIVLAGLNVDQIGDGDFLL